MTKTTWFATIVIGAAWWVPAAGAVDPSSPPAVPPSAQPAKGLTLDLGNKVTMKLVQIPAGKFMMGSPKREKDRNPYESQHEVTISRPFQMGAYEVTQAQYEQVMGKNPSTGKYRGPTNPAGNMRWSEAAGFCKKLSKKTGKTVRLPTEAEWEYACRAGSTTRFYYGDDNNGDKLDEYMWYGKNSPDKTNPVGQKKPNAWGLYDMHGNVYEWVNDWNALYANAKSVVNPAGPEYGAKRIFRGGSVYRNNAASQCRSAYRNSEEGKNMVSDFVGFRVVVESQVEVPERPGRSPAVAAEPSTPPATPPATQPAKELTLDLGNKVTMKLALIPAGTFMMGSPKTEKDRNVGAESPQHEVTISRPFQMGAYEVTQAQYEQVMGKNPSTGKYRGPTNPAGNMRWSEAVRFCKKLSKKAGRTVRLPTEAEWEYACRAGSTTRFYYGDDNNGDKLDEYMWYGKNSPDKTNPVGQKKPNAWGLYDMHGNVYEWVSDWSTPYANAKSVVDPRGPEYGAKRIFRGGSVYHNTAASQCRSAYRNSEEGRNMASDSVGFRVVVESQLEIHEKPASPPSAPAASATSSRWSCWRIATATASW